MTQKLEIIFDTLRSSRKYSNLMTQPACSFVIGWDVEQTVQFEGMAVEATGPDLERFQRTYFSVWPEGRSRMYWSSIAYLVVKPRWIRYSDFDQNPPVIEEMTIGGGAP